MSCESRTPLYKSVGTMGFCEKKQHPDQTFKNSLTRVITEKLRHVGKKPTRKHRYKAKHH